MDEVKNSTVNDQFCKQLEDYLYKSVTAPRKHNQVFVLTGQQLLEEPEKK